MDSYLRKISTVSYFVIAFSAQNKFHVWIENTKIGTWKFFWKWMILECIDLPTDSVVVVKSIGLVKHKTISSSAIGHSGAHWRKLRTTFGYVAYFWIAIRSITTTLVLDFLYTMGNYFETELIVVCHCFLRENFFIAIFGRYQTLASYTLPPHADDHKKRCCWLVGLNYCPLGPRARAIAILPTAVQLNYPFHKCNGLWR
jgi:hypothetical protein